MKALKWILWIGGGLVVLLIVAVAIVAMTFDPISTSRRSSIW